MLRLRCISTRRVALRRARRKLLVKTGIVRCLLVCSLKLGLRRAVAVTMRFLALAAALATSAANDDYVALKALYEATGGSGWRVRDNWDMSNTDVCVWWAVTCTGVSPTGLCAPACNSLPPHGDSPSRHCRRMLRMNWLDGTIPTEVGLLTKLTSLCARPLSTFYRPPCGDTTAQSHEPKQFHRQEFRRRSADHRSTRAENSLTLSRSHH